MLAREVFGRLRGTMDTQQAIEFLLEIQANRESELAELRAMNKRIERRTEASEKRIDKHDKQIKILGGLMKVGMKLLAKNNRAHGQFDRKMNALIEAQMRMEAGLERQKANLDQLEKTVDRYIKRSRGNGNGAGSK